MPIPNEKDRLRIHLEAIKEYADKILAEAQTIQEIQRDILNQIPEARELSRVMKELNAVTLDVGNGAAVVLQGVEAGEKFLREYKPLREN